MGNGGWNGRCWVGTSFRGPYWNLVKRKNQKEKIKVIHKVILDIDIKENTIEL